MIDTDELATYEQMTAMTPSDELEDAVGNLLAEVKRLKHEYRHHPQVNRCPNCRSDNIGITEYHIHGGECHEVECSDCESIWWEAWKHMGIEMKEGEDNR